MAKRLLAPLILVIGTTSLWIATPAHADGSSWSSPPLVGNAFPPSVSAPAAVTSVA